MGFVIMTKEKNSSSKILFNQFIDSIKKNYTPKIYTYSNNMVYIGKHFLGDLKVEKTLIFNHNKTLGMIDLVHESCFIVTLENTLFALQKSGGVCDALKTRK